MSLTELTLELATDLPYETPEGMIGSLWYILIRVLSTIIADIYPVFHGVCKCITASALRGVMCLSPLMGSSPCGLE